MFSPPPVIEEPNLTCCQKLKFFFVAHWRGVICFLVPLILTPILLPFPGKNYQWCAYTLVLMAIFWVSECIPLAVTSFFPVLIFPFSGIMGTTETCRCYINDTVLMFIGSLFLAYAVEQSGLHKRLAFCTIRCIGYSHYKLLLAMCTVTTFISMWITNTAATTMMIPINFALLRVFEEQKVINMYEKTADGEEIASDITTCYFCAATFSATVGGIGTLVGTATNLVFKGLFTSAYPDAPEYLSFPKFSAFSIPYMIVMEAFVYLYLIIVYFGFCRPNSAAAKSAVITDSAKAAAKDAIERERKNMGSLSYWEAMVILLFGGAMIGFFCRAPQVFHGWGDLITAYFNLKEPFIRDSAWAMLISFLMYMLPSTLSIIKNCTAKYEDELPKTSMSSVLIWKRINAEMPFSFMFLLGGGFALSTCAKVSGLNEKIGESLRNLKDLPNSLILFIVIVAIVFVTNFASNVAVCNVFTPIAMQLAKEMHQNPLWYNVASGLSASYCFMIPVGTPGNLIVQSAAKIPTGKMIKAGLGPSITTIIITWIAMYLWAPVIWPDLKEMPSWATLSDFEGNADFAEVVALYNSMMPTENYFKWIWNMTYPSLDVFELPRDPDYTTPEPRVFY